MDSNKKNMRYTIIILLLSLVSCRKFLDEKPSRSLNVPSTLTDLQALLDNHDGLNKFSNLPDVAADDYYLTTPVWSVLHVSDRQAYIWDPNTMYNAWAGYSRVRDANVILRALDDIDISPSESSTANNIRGQAMFHRAIAFHYMAQLYCRPYSSTATTDLGIALRLSPDVEVPSTRATVAETYGRILDDLKNCVSLLPETSIAINRPNRRSALGALARVYLSMRDYPNAGKYADSCLRKYGVLMDFNSLDPTSNVPIGLLNPETLHYIETDGISVSFSTATIDTNLYNSYDNDDLRKSIFFKPNGLGGHVFKGAYNHGGWNTWNGIATDEIYLIRAEAATRAGLKDSALADLNRLMVTRWKAGTFVPFTAATAEEARDKILLERRKELVYRGLRWSDLRRLNLENQNISLTRVINGTTYVLPPNDLRWVWLIPQEVIQLSGMPQNPR